MSDNDIKKLSSASSSPLPEQPPPTTSGKWNHKVVFLFSSLLFLGLAGTGIGLLATTTYHVALGVSLLATGIIGEGFAIKKWRHRNVTVLPSDQGPAAVIQQAVTPALSQPTKSDSPIPSSETKKDAALTASLLAANTSTAPTLLKTKQEPHVPVQTSTQKEAAAAIKSEAATSTLIVPPQINFTAKEGSRSVPEIDENEIQAKINNIISERWKLYSDAAKAKWAQSHPYIAVNVKMGIFVRPETRLDYDRAAKSLIPITKEEASSKVSKELRGLIVVSNGDNKEDSPNEMHNDWSEKLQEYQKEELIMFNSFGLVFRETGQKQAEHKNRNATVINNLCHEIADKILPAQDCKVYRGKFSSEDAELLKRKILENLVEDKRSADISSIKEKIEKGTPVLLIPQMRPGRAAGALFDGDGDDVEAAFNLIHDTLENETGPICIALFYKPLARSTMQREQEHACVEYLKEHFPDKQIKVFFCERDPSQPFDDVLNRTYNQQRFKQMAEFFSAP